MAEATYTVVFGVLYHSVVLRARVELVVLTFHLNKRTVDRV